ncbi:HD domain-containing protein [Aspergillus undulatus]|uniref:HD domain-containing protein n=1 Tax=Aspergillus undulatus TaxID=1810928 RepID=UPI003CCD727F
MSTPHPLIKSITTFVHDCMKNHDPSHNPAHITRVVNLALRILRSEQKRTPSKELDELTIHLAALLHDISDRKYLPRGSDQDADNSANAVPPERLVEHILISHGADIGLASRVQKIVNHVSYITEKKNPEVVRRLIEEEDFKELAIVQDADRLDAIGAVGIGRCFTFLGAKGRVMLKGGEEWEMENSIRHFGEKLEKLEGMMKTGTGREMARVRTERIVEFKRWWAEEMGDAGL